MKFMKLNLKNFQKKSCRVFHYFSPHHHHSPFTPMPKRERDPEPTSPHASSKTSRLHPPRTCAAAGCTASVVLPLNEIPLCERCNNNLADLSDSAGLHWFTCHIDPSFIRWSSHPAVLPPTSLPLAAPQPLPSTYTNALAVSAAARAIRAADCLLICAGAGMSCDSGLPDYRGSSGFYRMGGKDIAMDAVNFHPDRGADFLLSMGFITTMKSEFRQKKPHDGYHVLKRMADAKAQSSSSFVLTSNIDAYFLRAGFDEDHVYESHGSCNLLQCTKGGTWEDSCDSGIWKWPTILNESGENMIQIDEHLRVTDECVSMLPRCPKCGAYARPHVSHSTDYPEDVVPTRKSRQERALVDWLESIGNKKLVVLEVGCGTSIHSLRSETEIIIGKRQMIEKDEGATTLIRIDPGNADVPVGHVGVRMKAMEALVGIEKEILMM